MLASESSVTRQKVPQRTATPATVTGTIRGMKYAPIFFQMLSFSLVGSCTASQTLDWASVEKIAPRTRILVTTHQQIICHFVKASKEQLFCQIQRGDSHPKQGYDSDVVLDRSEIRAVKIGPYGDSKGLLSLRLAAGAGGGVDSAGRRVSFGGVKIGGPFSLDLQYDRIQGRNGFSAEGSPLLPVFRVPRFHGGNRRFVKLFAEPGLGYRAGKGSFGAYSCSKGLAGAAL